MSQHLRYDLFNETAPMKVVLLHSLALDATIWRDFVPLLGTDVAGLAPDLPGHGRTPTGNPESVESMADGVADLITSLKWSDVTLIGMSLGGSVAQAVAIRHPALVGRLGLLDTTAWYGEGAPAAWAVRAEQAQQRGLSSLAGFQLERWFTDAFRVSSPALCAELLEIFQRNEVENYVKSCTALGAMDLRDGLATIAVPTAIVVGELDQATPPSHAEALAAAIPDSTLTVVPECKHLSTLERPGEVIAALRSILT
jgi:3-oxoadipate enol-lactonase